jgi:hypothetical protein
LFLFSSSKYSAFIGVFNLPHVTVYF